MLLTIVRGQPFADKPVAAAVALTCTHSHSRVLNVHPLVTLLCSHHMSSCVHACHHEYQSSGEGSTRQRGSEPDPVDALVQALTTMVKKGLSLDQKRGIILGIFHENDEVFQLKEIEKKAAARGVTLQSIKDVVQSLVDDDLVHQVCFEMTLTLLGRCHAWELRSSAMLQVPSRKPTQQASVLLCRPWTAGENRHCQLPVVLRS
jgi:Mnd1 HTH domain